MSFCIKKRLDGSIRLKGAILVDNPDVTTQFDNIRCTLMFIIIYYKSLCFANKLSLPKTKVTIGDSGRI